MSQHKMPAYGSSSAPSDTLLGHCAEEYALSLADPFEGPEGACIPDYPALMTERMRVWVKGNFATSSVNGFGYIAMCPLDALSSNQIFLKTTSPASTLTQIDFTSGADVSDYVSNSPYSTAAGFQWRVVSAGLRILYDGNELQRGGLVVGLHEPGHEPLQTATQASMLQFKEARQFSITSKVWTTLLHRPVDSSDINFSSQSVPFINQGGGYMAFIVQSYDTTGTNQQSFAFEAVVNIEVQGANAVHKKPSHVDPVGHGAVNAITNMAPNMHKPHQMSGKVLGDAVVGAANAYVEQNVTKTSHGPGKKKNRDKSSGSNFMSDVLGFAGDVLPVVGSIAGMFF